MNLWHKEEENQNQLNQKGKYLNVRLGLIRKLKKEWKITSKKLECIGILIEVDMVVFSEYCEAYSGWKEAGEFISNHGTIVKTPRC